MFLGHLNHKSDIIIGYLIIDIPPKKHFNTQLNSLIIINVVFTKNCVDICTLTKPQPNQTNLILRGEKLKKIE